MDTNHECKNSQFSDTLAGFFGKNINLAHIKLLSLFITALCKARTVCFSKLATCFDSKAKSDSCLRRIQRFYAKHTLDSDLVARLIFRLLPVKGPLQLAIDRTSWQFGKTAINIFMLAVVHDGKPELQVIISYNQPQDSVGTYRRRWQIETMFKAMKSAGFNMEDTHLTDPERVGKLLLMVMIAFVWCYNIGELVHRKIKPLRILKHGRKRASSVTVWTSSPTICREG